MPSLTDPTALHSLPGADDIYRRVLPNGITILSRNNPACSSFVIDGYLPVGGLFDPDAQLGLADFTANALLRGTAKHDFQEIYEILESAGAYLGASGGTHTTGFSGRALVEDLELILGLLNEALRSPVFPEVQVERLRSQWLSDLAMRAQDTGAMASLAFDGLVYANHPYSRPEDGYPHTIQAIQSSDLARFHQVHYGPRGLVIAVVGAIQPERAADTVERILGDWSNPDQPVPPELPPLTPLTQRVTRRVTIPGKAQADLLIGAAGPARRAPDYHAASLGNNILGQFGMMGRIGESVREKAGLAYYAHSSLSGGLGPGAWYASAGVAPQDVQAASDLIIQEITRFVSGPVSAEELADSQAHFIGRLPATMESNSGVSNSLLNLERHGLDLEYYRRYADQIQSITVEAVLAAAQRYLQPDRLAVAVAGP